MNIAIMLPYLLLVLACGALVIILDRSFPILRDGPTPDNPDRQTTSYSLARVQMAFWTVLVVGALFWVLGIYAWESFYVVKAGTAATFKGNINGNLAALLGISGATGIVSAAVDAQKDSMVQTAAATFRASARAIVGLNRQIATTLPVAAGSAGGVTGALARQQLQTLKEQRSRYRATMTKPAVVIERNRRTATHTQFLRDLLVDENGNSLHRLQMVLFTLVYGAYFFIQVGATHDCNVPLSEQALYLMGVSSLVYVGFKVPGRSPTSPAPSQSIAAAVGAYNAQQRKTP
ncbi:hypothetical protein [Paraburkholderia sp. J10-1]|uniref:hypothetical protein n=1 Tax=Paraburkholderia sp. J10-1 TaxID=2805430 RepID=UPI002AB75594|nr:hypothetical protein [Paraburkholderia sp. J10-1]